MSENVVTVGEYQDDEVSYQVEALRGIILDLPENNIDVQKVQHNKTIENYIKLALETAEETTHLEIFLSELILALKNSENHDLARDALLIWAPAAEIAGMGEVKEELESLAFGILFPEDAEMIIEAYSKLGGQEAMQEMVDMYVSGIGHILAEDLAEQVPGFEVSGRKKSHYSVWRKHQRKNKDYKYMLPDFFGIRIVVDDGEDGGVGSCWLVASAVERYFENDTERTKDYISDPKPNGYKSLHLTLLDDVLGAPLELQVRTQTMHDRAENLPGVSHMAYEASSKYTPFKYDGKENSKRIYSWRDNAAAEIRDRKANGSNDLKSLNPDKNLIFTPDGNLYQINIEDSALDFSFAVHGEKALRTKRICVDGKPVGFNTLLPTHVTVSIEYSTKKESIPRLNWLAIVKSKKAERELRRTGDKA
ncbi:MAG: hypothetical protein AAB395_00050 [Patescibacteria group bacterium]